ncbi:MAG: radical SAM protein [Anaerolineae bacterium]|nr:radical SAM protein [Anaerolineae bacterium]
MSKSIYLINPRADFPSYYSAEIYTHFGLSPVAYTADLAIATVAALVPADFEVTLCDEQITPVNLNHPADYVGLTGKSSQVGRMIELAQHFQQRGKTVIIGGPFASLSPEVVRPYCDILVRGESETIAPQLFANLEAGRWQAEYMGAWSDLRQSPIPRWDLYPNHSALSGCVQTSRGCPFECEFCDVIQYAGRRQRHKPVDQILVELDSLYQHGYSLVFIADDNFTASRRRAKELLIALRSWNNRQPDGRLTFITQLSIDAAHEDEILQLCAEAGIYYVLIGIETPNEDSLRESKKRQNLGINLTGQIQRFLDYGIGVMGGMMVGFDADGPDIFERQYQFAMNTPIPIFMLGALTAPPSTPLYQRLRQDNRIVADIEFGANTPWETNIIPKQMSRQTLFAGLRWLGNRLYHPTTFGQRVRQFLDSYQPPPFSDRPHRKPNQQLALQIMKVTQNVTRLGSAEAQMFLNTAPAAMKHPVVQGVFFNIMAQYHQIRYMYQQGGFWEPQLAELNAPDLSRF